MDNQLARLRHESGWTQFELARRLEVSRQTVNSVEKGRYDPGLRLAFRIAAVFGLPIEEVFAPGQGEDENPYAPI